MYCVNQSFISDVFQIRKFKLDSAVCDLENQLEQVLTDLSDSISPVHRQLAPDCFNNMALFGDMGCRIGNQGDLPYSGATCVVDYCAHSHKVKKNSSKYCKSTLELNDFSSLSKQYFVLLHLWS